MLSIIVAIVSFLLVVYLVKLNIDKIEEKGVCCFKCGKRVSFNDANCEIMDDRVMHMIVYSCKDCKKD